MTRWILGILTSLLTATPCVAPRAAATTLARMTLEELALAADTVVRVRCVATVSRWDSGMIWTLTEFEVLERLKGTPGHEIRVRVPGGRVGHVVTTIESAPRFRPGEETVLFLESTSGDDYSVIAWARGTFRVHKLPLTGEEAVTQDCSASVAFNPETRRFESEGIHDLSLTAFRRRLAAALSPAQRGRSR